MNNIDYITSNTEAAEDFSRWFSLVYDRLKNSLQVHTPSGEDVFHDTFLQIYQRILRQGSVEGYASYFAKAYQHNLQKRNLRELRFFYPDELFFQMLNMTDERDGNEPDEREICALAAEVDRFVKSRFSREEYGLYSLHTGKGGFSPGELACYTGLSYQKVSCILFGIKKEISQQVSFRLRWRRCIFNLKNN